MKNMRAAACGRGRSVLMTKKIHQTFSPTRDCRDLEWQKERSQKAKISGPRTSPQSKCLISFLKHFCVCSMNTNILICRQLVFLSVAIVDKLFEFCIHCRWRFAGRPTYRDADVMRGQTRRQRFKGGAAGSARGYQKATRAGGRE